METKAEAYINTVNWLRCFNLPIRLDKISSENEIVFLSNIGKALCNAKSSKARLRLYAIALNFKDYSWFKHLDTIKE
jgi:hypothetical protein